MQDVSGSKALKEKVRYFTSPYQWLHNRLNSWYNKCMKYKLSAYKDLYIETARVYLKNLSQDMSTLENNHNDTYAIQDSYISAHSLKSQSAVMGFTEMETLCQVMEELFHDLREGDSMLTNEMLILLE